MEKYDTTGLNPWKYIDNTIQPKLQQSQNQN